MEAGLFHMVTESVDPAYIPAWNAWAGVLWAIAFAIAVLSLAASVSIIRKN